MMLSVLKHTETPVKFWFLKNYLSPTVKVCCKKISFLFYILKNFSYIYLFNNNIWLPMFQIIT